MVGTADDGGKGANSLDGVASSRIVCVSASRYLPLTPENPEDGMYYP